MNTAKEEESSSDTIEVTLRIPSECIRTSVTVSTTVDSIRDLLLKVSAASNINVKSYCFFDCKWNLLTTDDNDAINSVRTIKSCFIETSSPIFHGLRRQDTSNLSPRKKLLVHLKRIALLITFLIRLDKAQVLSSNNPIWNTNSAILLLQSKDSDTSNDFVILSSPLTLNKRMSNSSDRTSSSRLSSLSSINTGLMSSNRIDPLLNYLRNKNDTSLVLEAAKAVVSHIGFTLPLYPFVTTDEHVSYMKFLLPHMTVLNFKEKEHVEFEGFIVLLVGRIQQQQRKDNDTNDSSIANTTTSFTSTSLVGHECLLQNNDSDTSKYKALTTGLALNIPRIEFLKLVKSSRSEMLYQARECFLSKFPIVDLRNASRFSEMLREMSKEVLSPNTALKVDGTKAQWVVSGKIKMTTTGQNTTVMVNRILSSPIFLGTEPTTLTMTLYDKTTSSSCYVATELTIIYSLPITRAIHYLQGFPSICQGLCEKMKRICSEITVAAAAEPNTSGSSQATPLPPDLKSRASRSMLQSRLSVASSTAMEPLNEKSETNDANNPSGLPNINTAESAAPILDTRETQDLSPKPRLTPRASRSMLQSRRLSCTSSIASSRGLASFHENSPLLVENEEEPVCAAAARYASRKSIIARGSISELGVGGTTSASSSSRTRSGLLSSVSIDSTNGRLASNRSITLSSSTEKNLTPVAPTAAKPSDRFASLRMKKR